jgi:DNA-binding LacI/PurR family transcriptional regulator
LRALSQTRGLERAFNRRRLTLSGAAGKLRALSTTPGPDQGADGEVGDGVGQVAAEDTSSALRGRATLEEVAELAGVSRATVSRVINGKPRVSRETRVAVERAATRLGYVPNRAARSLVTRRNDSIGLVIPEPTAQFFNDPFFPRLVKGVTEGLAEPGVQLVLFMPQSSAEEARLADYFSGGHVDGVLIVSLHGLDGLPLGLKRHGIPLVLCGRPMVSADLSYVDADNEHGAMQAVAHLVDQGRKVIATVAGPQDMGAGVDRLEGYRRGLRAAGRELSSDLEEVADFTFEGGQAAMGALLERRPDVDAVFVTSELMALGAMNALRAHDRRVPDDVAVVGFDDSPVGLTANPPLSTIRQPTELMGLEMTRLLLRMISSGDHRPQHLILGTELIVRASSVATTARRRGSRSHSRA